MDRTKNGLNSLKEVSILYQFLYSSAENEISFTNGIGVPLSITMTADFQIMLKNHNFPDTAPSNAASDFTVGQLIDLIGYLKESPPSKTFKCAGFTSYWDEIKTMVATTNALNSEPLKPVAYID